MRPKTDSGNGAHAAKVQLRRHALAGVKEAHVFDGFSGLGEMWRMVWRDAASYLGCDERPWTPAEEHRRLVCDNRLALRSLDLAAFNVFDFDAYGSPWEQVLILCARRTWKPGELGALVLTDGGSMHTRFGTPSRALTQLCGISVLPRSVAGTDPLEQMALAAFAKRSHVDITRCWRARGNGSGRGQMRMTYTAITFRGAAVA